MFHALLNNSLFLIESPQYAGKWVDHTMRHVCSAMGLPIADVAVKMLLFSCCFSVSNTRIYNKHMLCKTHTFVAGVQAYAAQTGFC